jgi:hypothetical protein
MLICFSLTLVSIDNPNTHLVNLYSYHSLVGDLHDGTGLSDGFPPGGVDGHEVANF